MEPSYLWLSIPRYLTLCVMFVYVSSFKMLPMIDSLMMTENTLIYKYGMTLFGIPLIANRICPLIPFRPVLFVFTLGYWDI